MTDTTKFLTRLAEGEPVYVYAGANVGGQMLNACGLCGALLQEDRLAQHDYWHGHVQALAQHVLAQGEQSGDGEHEEETASGD